MEKIAQQIAKKYKVDYDELVGRGKSHDVQSARRELAFQLLKQEFDVHKIAELLGNRSINTIRRLSESYSSRKNNERIKTGSKS